MFTFSRHSFLLILIATKLWLFWKQVWWLRELLLCYLLSDKLWINARLPRWRPFSYITHQALECFGSISKCANATIPYILINLFSLAFWSSTVTIVNKKLFVVHLGSYACCEEFSTNFINTVSWKMPTYQTISKKSVQKQDFEAVPGILKMFNKITWFYYFIVENKSKNWIFK